MTKCQRVEFSRLIVAHKVSLAAQFQRKCAETTIAMLHQLVRRLISPADVVQIGAHVATLDVRQHHVQRPMVLASVTIARHLRVRLAVQPNDRHLENRGSVRKHRTLPRRASTHHRLVRYALAYQRLPTR